MTKVWGVRVLGLGLLTVAAGLALLPSGCTRLGGQSAGVSGAYTETFRGRWWNYYERGNFYLDRGDYAQAVSDYETALLTRKEDQLWPRTYGLHFLPEYFPHRELGIANFYTGNIDAAEEYIQQSLDMQYSARGSYYLDEIRRARITAAGGDTEAPTVEIASNTAGIAELIFTLQGVARDNQYVSEIYVEGTPVPLRFSEAEVPFEQEVTLGPGDNTVHLRVVDIAGNETESNVPLTTDVDGPLVSLDAVQASAGRITGIVFDASGVEFAEIGGTRVEGPEDGHTLQIDVPMPPPSAEEILYRAVDRLGNTSIGSLASADQRVASLGRGTGVPLPASPYWLPLVASSMLLGQVESTIRVEIQGIEDGQEFFDPTIVLNCFVSSPSPLASVTLNGQELPLIQGRNELLLSRKHDLKEGLESETLTLVGTDVDGNTATAELTVALVEPIPVGKTSSKLTISILGSILDTPNAETDALASQILTEFQGKLADQERFTVVDRSMLDFVLNEQILAEISSQGPQQGMIKAAEAVFTGRVRQDAETVEIVLSGYSTETSELLTSRVEVAGSSNEIGRLVDYLAVRLAQEFPRATGEVLDFTADNQEFTAALGTTQGIRDAYKCVIFGPPEPVMKGDQILGYKSSKPVFEGVFRGVDELFSTGQVYPPQPDGSVEVTIEPSYVVLAK